MVLLLADSSWTVCRFFFVSMRIADGGGEISEPTQDSNGYCHTSVGGSLAVGLVNVDTVIFLEYQQMGARDH
jgi:hypothetical protein